MAIVVPMRKKYKPRNIVEAVVDNVLRLRSNCHTMTNPNTPAQQYVRSRFQLMQALQKGLAPLFKRGFDRCLNARERWVGSYHLALGHNMTEAARYDDEKGQWYCDFSRFTLCEHRSKAPKHITVQRKDNLLILSYLWKGQAERTSILWAVYNRKRAQWVQGIVDTRLNGQVTACAIPPEWKEEPLEVLIGFGRDAEGRGKLRGTHHCTFVKSEGIVTVKGNMRGTQSAVQQGGTSPSTHTVTVWHILPQQNDSWIKIQDDEGMTVRIKVCYLIE